MGIPSLCDYVKGVAGPPPSPKELWALIEECLINGSFLMRAILGSPSLDHSNVNKFLHMQILPMTIEELLDCAELLADHLVNRIKILYVHLH
jgi:hypothetical protein